MRGIVQHVITVCFKGWEEYAWVKVRLKDMILSRLDQFSTYAYPDGFSPSQDYVYVGGTTKSDHIPVHFLN